MQQSGWGKQNVLGRRKQKKRPRKKSSLKGGGRKSHDEKSWGQVFAQARLGFWWGLFPVRPGKCGPQLSRLMKATTCSSLKASRCFLAASSCSSAHTICQRKVKTDNHVTETPQQSAISTFKFENNMLQCVWCFLIEILLLVNLKQLKTAASSLYTAVEVDSNENIQSSQITPAARLLYLTFSTP